MEKCLGTEDPFFCKAFLSDLFFVWPLFLFVFFVLAAPRLFHSVEQSL